MLQKIKNNLYKIKFHYGTSQFVECDNIEDLFFYIATELVPNGYVVSSVSEICVDGSTPKVKVFTDKRFKKILSDHLKNKSDSKKRKK